MLLLSSLFLTLTSTQITAGELNIAVAGNFFKPLKKLSIEFEKNTKHKLNLSVGSTGKLYAQITHGAPFEIFLAADQKRVSALVEQKQAVKESQFTYAIGRLVLWSKDPDFIDQTEAALSSPNVTYIAIANPKTAPYGKQAINTLKALGLHQTLQDKLVLAQNVGQAFQYISSGNTQLGIIALSQVTANQKLTSGSAWIIPTHLYQPIKQDAVLLKKGESNPVAQAFLDYLKTPIAIEIIRSYGYEVET